MQAVGRELLLHCRGSQYRTGTALRGRRGGAGLLLWAARLVWYSSRSWWLQEGHVVWDYHSKKKRKSQLDYILSPRTSYATVNNYNKEKFWSTGGHYPENADSARVWKDKTEKVKDESWLGGNQSAIGRSNR